MRRRYRTRGEARRGYSRNPESWAAGRKRPPRPGGTAHGLISSGASGHGQGAGGIDAVQPAHARRHEAGPTAGTAAHIEAFGIGRQLIPGKDGEVVAKHPLGFAGGMPC